MQMDTASSCTILNEKRFQGVRSFKTKPIQTVAGWVRGLVIEEGRGMILFSDASGGFVPVSTEFYLLRDGLLSRIWRHLRFWRKTPLPNLPRNILGRDILNKFFLIARYPQELLLTDELPKCNAFYRSFEAPQGGIFVPGPNEGNRHYAGPHNGRGQGAGD